MKQNFNFIIDQQVLDLGVMIRGVQIDGINNQSYTPELQAYLEQEINQLLTKENLADLKENNIIEGFYQLHQKVNVPRRKNLPSSENLLKVLLKKQTMHQINPVVDLYNILSMKSKLALGAHDIDKITGNMYLKLTTGQENYYPLLSTVGKPVIPGVYSYLDDDNDILCYLEIRQVDKTKIMPTSENIFFIVQGNEQTPMSYVDAVARELISLITKYCGGQGRLLKL